MPVYQKIWRAKHSFPHKTLDMVMVLLLGSFVWGACNPAPIGPPSSVPPCLTSQDCKAGLGCTGGVCIQSSKGEVFTSEQPSEIRGEVSNENPNPDNKEQPIEPKTEISTEPNTETSAEPNTEIPTEPGIDGGEVVPERECPPGKFRSCYTAAPKTKNIAGCKEGLQVCGTTGTWGVCQGEITPQTEICDNKDNDCNGTIDDNFIEKEQPCADNTQVGECQIGKYTSCIAGKLTCEPNTKPGENKEICDGKDNNCDGQIDENPPCSCTTGDTQDCGSDAGECSKGTKTCNASQQWGQCVGETTGTVEICDGKDNDCDGQTDENFPKIGQLCESGKGICKAQGKIICNVNNRNETICDAQKGTPQAELCDGKDNNCDGQIDETFPNLNKSCDAGQGTCKTTGTSVCTLDQTGTECNAKAKPPTPEICNGKDDDCDGKIDNKKTGDAELLSQSCYTGPVSTKNVGDCKSGSQICENGTWAECKGETKPQAQDSCNGNDEDCDGTTNTGCGCTNGRIQVCGNTTGECKGGNQTCVGGKWGACTGGTLPITELCDGKDNDCDGVVDEDFTNLGQKCSVGMGECKKEGSWKCNSSGNTTKCNQTAGTPTTETCNGKDDDCDGTIDNGNPEGGKSCKDTTQKGVCQNGLQTCAGGQLVCKSTTRPSIERCRTTKDEDCDGQVDEICGPKYPYAIIKADGSAQKRRGFRKTGKMGVGIYKLQADAKCPSRPIFLTAQSLYIRSVVYDCEKGGEFVIRTGKEHKGSAPKGNQDAPFYAVQPLSTDTFATIDPKQCEPKKPCKGIIKSGQMTKVLRSGKGFFAISSPLCNQTSRPIFASIKHNAPGGFIRAYNSGGSCFVDIRDKNNQRVDHKFSIWLPDPTLNSAAWATVSPQLSSPTIQASNNFSDQRALWTGNNQWLGAKYCPLSLLDCPRPNINFHSWASPSAVVVGLRHRGKFPRSTLGSSFAVVNAKHLVSSALDSSGVISINDFYILYVQ